jgi:Domain of unknown function (DUF4190)
MAYQPGSYSAPTSGKAVGSLVCGIAGLAVCAPVGIVAVILGTQARNEITASGGRIQGDGMALAGLIMGWVAIGLFVLGALIAVIVLAAAAGS